MNIDTTFLRLCIASLEHAVQEMENNDSEDDLLYQIYRAACVKEFEIILEQCGKLLRKRLRPYFSSNQAVDRLYFKDLFRHTNHHDLINTDATERWMDYRDQRNYTGHDYGKDFAEATLKLMPTFIIDAKALADIIEAASND
ncbi:MAG: nucleotidyltransferase substrate binding protein [Bacteroidetes bacterium]|nr:nucleotidyltransferase substrate binding protein [Bacteroidota bacterium]